MAASKRFRILVLAAALVLLAAAPGAAQATWTQVPSPNRPGSNELQGADGAVTSQVWAVGRVVDASANPAAYRSLILRWDGSAWAPAAAAVPSSTCTMSGRRPSCWGSRSRR